MITPGTGFNGVQERARSEKGSRETESEKKKKLEKTKRGGPQATKGLKGATGNRNRKEKEQEREGTTKHTREGTGKRRNDKTHKPKKEGKGDSQNKAERGHTRRGHTRR